MASPTICCIPIEVKSRTLDSRLFLALKLLAHGFDVLLGEKNAIYDSACALTKPFIYLSKGEAAHSAGSLARLKQAGGAIVLLDEEGGIFRPNWDVFPLRTDDQILRHIDLYCAWGAKQKYQLCKRSNVLQEQDIVITGNPRFDMAGERFNPAFEKIASLEPMPTPGFTLINTSFVHANDAGAHGEDAFSLVSNFTRELWGDRYDHRAFTKIFHYEKLLFEYFTEAVAELASIYPEKQFVIRPHPRESLDTYHARLKQFANVLISNSSNVRYWIQRATHIIHHDCTTAIEGRLSGTAAFAYQPVMDKHFVAPLTQVVSTPIGSLDQLLDAVNETETRSKALSQAEIQALKPWIDTIDTHDSTERLAREFEKRFASEQNFRRFTRQSRDLSAESESKTVAPQAATETKLQHALVARTKAKFPGLTLDELDCRIEILRAFDATLPAVHREEQAGAFLFQSGMS